MSKSGIYKILYHDKNGHLRSRTCFLMSDKEAKKKVGGKVTEVVYLRPEWRLVK